MTSSPPPTQTQRPMLSTTNHGNDAPRLLTKDSLFAPSGQKDKMVPDSGNQQPQPVPWQVFSGPSTNFIFSQPGSYNITMGPANPPLYQQEYPYSVSARPPRYNP